MAGVIQGIFIIILSVELIMGNLGNGFIALVNYMDWVKRRKISLVDKILTALAISRICQLWSVLLSVFTNLLHPALEMTRENLRIINITWLVANHFSLWLATSLSIFYFLKIANFSHSIFLYLKWRVKKVVSVTLMLSLLPLFLNIVLMNSSIDEWVDGRETDGFYSFSSNNSAIFPRFVLFTNTMFSLIPFAVFLLNFLLLIFSLWKHLKMMQHRVSGPRDASTTAHIKALQMVITFLLLYAVFFLSLVSQLCSSEFMKKINLILFWSSVIIVFPASHSFVLILGNNKLRVASLHVLWRLSCRSKELEPLGP